MNSTPDTAEPGPAPDAGEPGEEPESRWGSLLAGLTAEELRQYGAMAQDQIGKENRWAAVHLVLLLGSLAALTFVVRDLLDGGFAIVQIYGLILAGFLIYWPYRSLKIKRLWRGHRSAVENELARRASARGRTTSEAEEPARRAQADGDDET